MFFAWVLAFFGLLLLFLEFFLPGMIMAVGGSLLLLASLLVFHMQNQSGAAVFFTYFFALGGMVYAITRLALWMVRRSAKKGTLCLELDQEGFKASGFNPKFIGKKGKAATDLRPSGHILIEGLLIQAVSQSGYIEKNSSIEVIGGDGGHLIVGVQR